ncbi:ubiquitin recognition factor in ER-associated degradation protein 1-like [Nasonia vitripennis]|uniref:Ubiquitin fusion degradation protein 1 homolog n=1 Tax=Nasonia vitripennis TaxID=7425 RepID=A0A7M7G0Z4_NASVI|nr:ubiquitin recognition factor in ER-associated degradation protein 1-like [Nasonia vitripennis]
MFPMISRMPGGSRRSFNTHFKCYSASMLPGIDRQDIEQGGKIILPPSALDILTRLNTVYPMLFKLTNRITRRETYCGVLEFIAGEGLAYLPCWMMRNLLLKEGDILNVMSVSLPVATYARFQPQSEDFLEITNPKAVLENGLRNFACLTAGDIIAISYNSRIYEMSVLETKPNPAVTIIECDMNVEFAPPVGYKEPEKPVSEEENSLGSVDMMPEPTGFVAFRGQGNRLDGKKGKESAPTDNPSADKPVVYVMGIPDYAYTVGTLKFMRNVKPSANVKEVKDNEEFKAFSGIGSVLR